ncbi:leucine-rich repeat neuronal protein 3 [Chanos chanos]|uniref:Leucine-rich repeat neuronal protein 3 n=1 Tax=Chanos chanos TaxID=29144 RepID=A0A6J2WWY4_CHACN|nr:leucine-rich repeat neuronal protein 3 [Chanos chanos]
MKDIWVTVCLVLGLSFTAHLQARQQDNVCLKLCKCEIRAWFSPVSIYMEAPTVDCSALGLLFLPERLPEDTQVFLFQANSIAQIERPLDYLVNLTEIDLSQNNLSTMSDIHLGHLPQLLSLHLEENWIQTLQDNCLEHLQNLQEFYVNHNLLSFIGPGAFQGLRRLLRLHLNSNHLKVIRKEWFEALPKLEILMIGENPIAQIQDMNFSPLGNLRSLVLARMNLSELPDNALTGLDNLESISFYDNIFSKVPKAALRKIKSLKFLDLNKNPIERIQKGDFVDMVKLKELGINSMPKLVSIDSFALCNLPELTKIEVTNNPRLSYIHPNAFYKLPKLETLMLNSNALRALHHVTVESLPNLREVSMHSNPIRCDCVVRWINMNKTNVRFMEPEALFCEGPPEFKGQHVRQVHFRDMMEICLPLITPESFPDHVTVGSGHTVSLHCRAMAEPQPEIYWVTPSGDKIPPKMASKKYHLHPEGTFEIYDVTEQEAGHYICVAHNLIGADMKSVMVEVNGYSPEPSNSSLNIQIKAVQPDSIRISWGPPAGILVSNIKWSTKSKTKNPALQFTARVPSDVQVFSVSHLLPLTQYEVCVEFSGMRQGHMRNCVTVSTVAQSLTLEKSDIWDATMISITCLVLIMATVTCSLIYMSLRSKHLHREVNNRNPGMPQGPCTCPSCQSPEFWGSTVKINATVKDFPYNSNNSV